MPGSIFQNFRLHAQQRPLFYGSQNFVRKKCPEMEPNVAEKTIFIILCYREISMVKSATEWFYVAWRLFLKKKLGLRKMSHHLLKYDWMYNLEVIIKNLGFDHRA